MSPKTRPPRTFKAFLSHRYKSPEVNLYFFDLCSEFAEIQFEVDAGTFSTNVTRLERMMRAADAFIGIYPFTGTSDALPTREELLAASKYFRLEFDLAIRARRPAMVFFDKRYKGLFTGPGTVQSMEFDALEVTAQGGSPTAGRYQQAFKSFCDVVFSRKQYKAMMPASTKSGVGLVLPPDAGEASGYPREAIDQIQATLEESGYDDVRTARWPPILNRALLSLLTDADWVITDIGDELAGTGILPYLHGAFVPTLRLWRVADPAQPLPSVAQSLYGSAEVGYDKDIVRWMDVTELAKGLAGRITSLDAPVRRMSTMNEAHEYFTAAALRKEAVFLSYSGQDEDFARALAAQLKKRFQLVFDYRDAGQSIRPGQPWMSQIFDQLAASALGIPVYSKEYLASGNCLHELQQLAAQHDAGKLALLPVKISRDKLDLPSYVENIQYLRSWEFPDLSALADQVVSVLTAGRRPS